MAGLSNVMQLWANVVILTIIISSAAAAAVGQNDGKPFIRGDTNADRSVDIGDAVYLLEFLFNAGDFKCFDAGDVNDSSEVNLSDAVYLLNFLFRGGAKIPSPYPKCGFDRHPDNLGCNFSDCRFEEEFEIGTLDMVYIPPGTFSMGSPWTEKGRDADEILHHVTLTCGFYISRTEVTQGFFEEIMGSNPSEHREGSPITAQERPVDSVTWYQATDFCRRLSRREGIEVRLPTEAEWEYACRAGTETRFWFGDALECDDSGYPTCSSLANKDNMLGSPDYSPIPYPVGFFLANPWGLSEAHGNVYEWCYDWYGPYPRGGAVDPIGLDKDNGDGKVLRGGGLSYVKYGRSAKRRHLPVGERGPDIGFRIVSPLCKLVPSS